MSAYEPPPHHADTPQQPQQPPPAAPPEPPRRRGVGLVLVAVLLAGLLGGVVGAVGYATLADDDSEPSGASTSTSDTLARDTTSSDAAPERSVQEVAAEVLPSVVKIDVVTEEGVGSGSGVILSTDGEILTNNHVVEPATDEGLIVAFDDGTTAPATVVGTDPLLDLAVIRAEGVSDLPTATLGSSDDLSVGQEVVAVGSPFGLESTVTSGIVSALDRPITAGSTPDGSTVFPAIQTDAAINPGNSGGALVDTEGQVVGINTAIRTDSSSAAQGGSIGLGFAIPIDEARPIADQLSQGETPTHARIGVTVSDALDENGVLGGARIEEVGSDGAAAAAGLETDDVVVRVDENLVGSSNDLVATIRGYRPGDEVTLTVVRDGEVEEAEVTLESDEGSPTS